MNPGRVPAEADGIQVNFCKNPACQNYGIPALGNSGGKPKDDGYIATGGGSSLPVLKCKICGEFPPIKSNAAIAEERARLLNDLTVAPEPSCPDVSCRNHTIPFSSKGGYQSFGVTTRPLIHQPKPFEWQSWD